jgi:hypothetical protein
VNKNTSLLHEDGPIRKGINVLSKCAASALGRSHRTMQEVENNHTS